MGYFKVTKNNLSESVTWKAQTEFHIVPGDLGRDTQALSTRFQSREWRWSVEQNRRLEEEREEK